MKLLPESVWSTFFFLLPFSIWKRYLLKIWQLFSVHIVQFWLFYRERRKNFDDKSLRLWICKHWYISSPHQNLDPHNAHSFYFPTFTLHSQSCSTQNEGWHCGGRMKIQGMELLKISLLVPILCIFSFAGIFLFLSFPRVRESMLPFKICMENYSFSEIFGAFCRWGLDRGELR